MPTKCCHHRRRYEKQTQVIQESRVWIAGMSDEGGADSFEAAAEVAVHPNSEEVAKLEAMVEGPVWGHLQNKEDGGTNDIAKYAVKRSLFYHDPEALPDLSIVPASILRLGLLGTRLRRPRHGELTTMFMPVPCTGHCIMLNWSVRVY